MRALRVLLCVLLLLPAGLAGQGVRALPRPGPRATLWAPREATWLDLMRKQSTPGLVDAVVARLGGFEPNADRDYGQRDRFSTAAALETIER